MAARSRVARRVASTVWACRLTVKQRRYISQMGRSSPRPAPAVQWKIYPLTYKLTIERRGAPFPPKYICTSAKPKTSKRPAPVHYSVHVRPTVHPLTVHRMALARPSFSSLTLCVAARGRGGRAVAAVPVPAFVCRDSRRVAAEYSNLE